MNFQIMVAAINYFLVNFQNKKFVIKWNTTSFTTEKSQSNRENNKWFIKRNLRFGYSEI